jgi:competence protein ComEA
MDETAAPWRALESAGGVIGAAGEPGPPSRSWSPGQLATAAAILVAGILGLVAVLLVVGGSRGSVVVDGDGPRVAGSGGPAAVGSTSSGGGRLVVDVQGAVLRPGLVQLPSGSRVADAIDGAGGFGPRVASDRVARSLNLAALVRDGDQIVVPSRDDPAELGSRASPAAGGGSAPGELVDLNHATAEALDALPGVGPATAAKIIAAREEQPFASVEDLKTRKVVGSAAFEKLRPLVTVR